MMDVVKVGVAPWIHMNPDCFDRIDDADCQVGVELDILRTVATIVNVTLSLVIVNGTGCGKTPEETGTNNSWDGLLGMLHRGEIDMIGNFCGGRKLGSIQQNVYSLSPSVWQFRQVFIIRTPEPPAIPFRPFAPFTYTVWLACFAVAFLYFGFLTFYRYLRFRLHRGSVECKWKFSKYRWIAGGLIDSIIPTQTNFSKYRSSIEFLENLSLQCSLAFWILFVAFMLMFYQTFILSTVLHPFPIYQPFSNAKELSTALHSGEYRLVTHKQHPSIPVGCLGKYCEKIFNRAIKKYATKFIPQASGGQLLSVIANQDPNETPKLVLIQGKPFLHLYFREFKRDRKLLWIMDGDEIQTSSRYVWRKDFAYANEFSKYIMDIGDFTIQSLNRYVQFYGPKPHYGDRYLKGFREKAISVSRIQALFLLHFSGMAVGIGVYFVEFWMIRRRRRKYTVKMAGTSSNSNSVKCFRC